MKMGTRLAWSFGIVLCIASAPLQAVAGSQRAATARQIASLKIGFLEAQGFLVSPDNRWISLNHTPGEKGEDCSLFERRTHRLTNFRGAYRFAPLVFSRDARHLVIWGYQAYQPLRGLKRKPPPR